MNPENRDTTVEQLRSLAQLPWHDHCVVIADATLPVASLDALPEHLRVSPGEGLKTLPAIEQLATDVLAMRSTRPLTLVAVGGGSVGDAVGFLASILWRGVELWHVPTTLLAMVDSAHGGKTAMNLGTAKNQLGTFHAASRVFLVEDMLASLPVSLRREGMTELLKALWLGERAAAALPLPQHVEMMAHAPFDLVRDALFAAVKRAVEIKREIVARDPEEQSGARTVLNLGHTLAHALELSAGMPHGGAVAWGLAAMLELAADRGLPAATVLLLREQLYSLLDPVTVPPSPEAMHEAMLRDKKRRDGRLRSVLLEAIGHPVIVDDISAEQWVSAFNAARRRIAGAPAHVSHHGTPGVRIDVQASKSELNRALLLAALRKGESHILGTSDAADVVWMRSALRSLGAEISDTGDGCTVSPIGHGGNEGTRAVREIQCGEAGTTFRFLLAASAMLPGRTRLHVAASLFRRPHGPLLDALTRAGASIAGFQDGRSQGYAVEGWARMPDAFEVDASLSSQFPSAIAMLAAASDTPFTLRLKGRPVSRPYLQMTLDLLSDAGVDVLSNDALLAFNPTPRLGEAWTMYAAPDASSLTIWQAARMAGLPLRLPEIGGRQPDAAAEEYLTTLQQHAGSALQLELTDSPDLLPVLAVFALAVGADVRFTGVEHVRGKESDRLEGLAASLRHCGHRVQAGVGELHVRPGSGPAVPGTVFRTQGDHRLVMAAFLYALSQPVDVEQPFTVSKSYPAFLRDARQAGWRVMMKSGEQGAQPSDVPYPPD